MGLSLMKQVQSLYENTLSEFLANIIFGFFALSFKGTLTGSLLLIMSGSITIVASLQAYFDRDYWKLAPILIGLVSATYVLSG